MRDHRLALMLVMPIACGPVPNVGESDAESESSSTDATTTETGADSCATEFWLHGEVIPHHVMLLVDASRSMGTSYDHDDDPGTAAITRWSTAQALVEQLVEANDDPPSSLFGVQRFRVRPRTRN